MKRRPNDPKPSEITPEALYLRRREFIKNGALFLATAAGVGAGLVALTSNKQPEKGEAPPAQPATAGSPPPAPAATAATAAVTASADSQVAAAFPRPRPKRHAAGATEPAPPPATAPAAAAPPAPRKMYTVNEALTPYADVTTYNNFYEFGTSKDDPAANAGSLKTRPWSVVIDGEVATPQTVDIDTLLTWFPLEERVYRMRCVEAWSMVIPWLGFPLGDLLKRVQPTSRAKYVAFTTLDDPAQMPGQRRAVLDWPYVEGLRLDEALHPLTLLASGLYGKPLPNQNGAPLRLVVPWKYGFKGIKSIVHIRLTATQPPTSWNLAAPDEYGFYANVNPAVDHPRWSQATERRIGEWRRRPTLPFNGYADEVAPLYAGMDLRKYF